MEKENEEVTSTIDRSKEGSIIKLAGILHILGNVFSGGLLGAVSAVLILILKKDLTSSENFALREIINFNISFYAYFLITWLLSFVLIGLLILPVVIVAWIFLMVKGTIVHLKGEAYEYPWIFRLV